MTPRPLCSIALLLACLLALAPAARADEPIPEGPGSGEAPKFVGKPATQRPVFVPQPPRHPFMAPNGRSNLHVDGYQTDAHVAAGPLGRGISRVSAFHAADCASVTFDSRGRIVTVCVGLQGPSGALGGLFLLDPKTLDTLAHYELPPRQPGGVGGNIFQDFAGGGYFYLDGSDRAVIPTTTRHIQVVAQTGAEPGFRLERDYDLTGHLLPTDKIISALPDWSGRIWFASTSGVVGTIDRRSGTVRTFPTGEPISNSIAVDATGAVYVVTDEVMYRFHAAANGTPRVRWRWRYPNDGVKKPGQSQAGSGTTPTVMPSGPWVAITDNSDPIRVVVLNKDTGARVCSVPAFRRGASSSDQSLIAAGRAIVVENNYGYEGPRSTEQGATTTPGLERVDVNRDGTGCTKRWHSDEIAPSVVPKVSLANGLVYTYTKPAGVESDPWYLTALDFRTGKTVYRALAGEGLGFNNNYAPVTIGPDGTAYVGTLGGIVALRDAKPPRQVAQRRPRTRTRSKRRARLALRLRYQRGRRCSPRRRVHASVRGPDRRRLRRVTFRYGKRRKVDARAPFDVRFRVGTGRFGYRVRARAILRDGRRLTLARPVRPCTRVAPRFAG